MYRLATMAMYHKMLSMSYVLRYVAGLYMMQLLNQVSLMLTPRIIATAPN
jgi:hypothetical protein